MPIIFSDIVLSLLGHTPVCENNDTELTIEMKEFKIPYSIRY